VLTREATEAELLKGIIKPNSHLGKAGEKLGVEVIAASNPQAKGRVERKEGLEQGRNSLSFGIGASKRKPLERMR
jgi:hypothetical protein